MPRPSTSASVEGVRVRAGVDLADACADPCGGVDLPVLGIDEHAGHDARVRELGHDPREPRFLTADVEAAFGSDLLAAFRDQHRHLRPQVAGDADHLVGRGHLQIELDVHQLAQATHVPILDVAPVLAQVDRDPVGSAQVRLDRRPHRVGLVRAPRLPQRGDVIDVDTELNHDRSPLLPRGHPS
jgi:hypothetical protein